MSADRFLEWVDRHEVDCVRTLPTFRNEPNKMAASGGYVPRDIGLVSLDVMRVHADWSGVQQHSEESCREAR